LVGRTDSNRSLGLRGKWKINIKMDLQVVRWTGLLWLRIRNDGGTCQWGNESSVSIECGEFPD
jgi:hypothetical protein